MSSTSLSSALRSFVTGKNQLLPFRIVSSQQTKLIRNIGNEHCHSRDGRKFFSNTSKADSKQRPIFVAATKQHVGKTTTCLAILSGLQKRFDKVGFIKPVGQQHVQVDTKPDDDGKKSSIRVDKDVVLIKEHFDLDHVDYKYMSPVIIPRGYTRKFVDGDISTMEQQEEVQKAYDYITSQSAVTLIEGTGHCAVGSIVGLNNAKVANILGADMVLVANGGLGKAFDELELNRVLCEQNNVRIAGVIINKVIPEKYEQTKHYLEKAMMQTWGIPLLGCVPDRPYLGCPALVDLERLFKTKLLSGSTDENRFRHYTMSDINLVTTSLKRFLENIRSRKPARTLYICHVTRDDLILGFLGEFQRRQRRPSEPPFEAALLVCGRRDTYRLSEEVEAMIRDLDGDGPSIMFVEGTTHAAMTKIHGFTPKLNIDDRSRVSVAVDHYEPYIDFDLLLERTREE
mmetsp:Transcript_23449/g.65094  ORF Transcript_23449/g.65094 Transcript_23449/m.65094 type:complete len:456 (-) Transcript_23449:1329-2696(-)|eukprot:CAMPEP_0172355642 /NCGR_PEP_ID=MMETSP1060-20121228/39_1 /TAXON_ID=37318 /ORGANISM="Pseudo-nitzschia pungens, Strain cf. cingulata" /LENGTH=455 /DNA_ID=CAMNT_0013075447 /DNA_START=174 /DNA_END=1541 /DNA_ORIENTATION=+